MDKKDFTASNFIPKILLDIIYMYILERDEKHQSYKIIGIGMIFPHGKVSRQACRIDARS